MFEDPSPSLEQQPKNNRLTARLRMGGRLAVRSRDTKLLDQVVTGNQFLEVLIAGQERARL